MADAEYIIDIAAEMPEGEVTAAQLDELISGLDRGGAKADAFEDAMASVSNQLNAAKRASAAANAELKDGQQEYRLLEHAALKASKAAERAFTRDGVVPDDLTDEMNRAQAAVDGYVDELRRLERNAADASDEQTRLARTMRNVQKASRAVDDKLGNATRKVSVFRGALGDIGGPLGEFGEKLLMPAQAFVDLNEQFGATTAKATVLVVGVASVVAVLGVLAIAAGAATVAMAALAVKLADNRREADLTAEAYEALNPRLRELSPIFEDLTRDTGLAANELRGLESELHDAGVAAGEMPAALRAAALAERALGSGGSRDFIKNIKEGKLAVDEFAATTQQKFGGIVQRQMLGLGAQTDRLKRNFSELFGSLEIEPVLKGIQRLVGLFDASTEAGQALQFFFEEFFGPIIAGAEKAAIVLEAFWLGFLIGLTEIFIALKPVIRAVQEFFGFEDDTFAQTLQTAEDLGKIVAGVFVGFVAILGVVGAAFAAAAAAAGLFVVGIVQIIDWLGQLGGLLVGSFTTAWESVTEFFSGLDWGEIGTQMMVGLAEGILGAAGTVVSAISGVVGGAIDRAKGLLGIASPSKVFAEFGGFTGEGFTMGVEAETANAQSALQALVEPPTSNGPAITQLGAQTALAASDAARGGSDGGGASGPSFDFKGANFNFYGVEGAEDAEARFAEMMTRLLEGDATALGGSEAA